MEDKNIRFGISIAINIIVVIIAVIIMYVIGSKGFQFGAAIFDEQSVDKVENAREVEVTIPVNITDSKIADIMYEKGLVEDKTVFKIQIALSEYKGKFKAGTYTLNTSMKPTEIMESLCQQNKDEGAQ
ncbi:MAG: endolytic transglycosylase MltG [Bacteroides sp.]